MKKILSLTAVFLLLICILVPAVCAAEISSVSSSRPYLCDYADLIPANEEKALEALLKENSDKAKIDIVLVTVNDTGMKTEEEYADDFYDENGYGRGENKDGVLMLISMNPRYVHITGTGKCTKIFNSEKIDELIDFFWSELSSNNFTSAGNIYADKVVSMKASFDRRPFILIGIALVIGFLIASVKTGKTAAAHTSVSLRKGAEDYTVAGSLAVERSDDRFLYSNVARAPRVQDTNRSGSHGGTHTSSSGTSHSGGGRSF